MPQQIDTRMKPMESTCAHTSLDRPPSETSRGELTPPDHPVLPRGEIR